MYAGDLKIYKIINNWHDHLLLQRNIDSAAKVEMLTFLNLLKLCDRRVYFNLLHFYRVLHNYFSFMFKASVHKLIKYLQNPCQFVTPVGSMFFPVQRTTPIATKFQQLIEFSGNNYVEYKNMLRRCRVGLLYLEI